MNYQPSFRTGGVPVAGPAFDDLGRGRPGADPHDAGPDAEPRRGGPRRRVPDRDIVDVGRSSAAAALDDPIDLAALASDPATGAAAQPAPRHSPWRGRYTKPLIALVILEITLVSGFHLRKRFAAGPVIVVPATFDERAVIT